MSDKPIMQNDDSSDILRQISGQLRLALANIYNSLDRLAPPDRRDREQRYESDSDWEVILWRTI